MNYLTKYCEACLCWYQNDGCLSAVECPKLKKDVKKENKTMDTKKRLSEWTLAELSKYCKSMIAQDYPKCEKCEARGICERAPKKWKFDTLTDAEKAIMRACGAKWVTKELNGTRFVDLWEECPKPNEGKYSSNNYIGAVDGDLFPSVSGGDCIELED